MEKVVERFHAKSHDGQIFEIIVYQKFLNTDSFEGTGSIPGLKRLVDSRGRHVQPVSGTEDEYDIVDDLGHSIRVRRI